MAFDLTTLNEEQLKPVLQTVGPVLVTAGAGSGKTRLLTYRVAHLIQDENVSAYNILAITFTNKAANEMKERLSVLQDSNRLWVSTFHSLCVCIMRKYVNEIGDYSRSFSIYDETEKEKLLKSILGENDDILKRASELISAAKNEGLDPERTAKKYRLISGIDQICDIYLKYQNALAKNNAFDFDDLLVTAYKILNTVPQAREYYQERFKYIHVDEFQDTNLIQYYIVKLLAQKYNNILVVGDEDQSIYGWRGANIENIKSFINDFNPKIYKLEQNYRSTKNILDLANKLIKNNTSRIDKQLWTLNETGAKPEYFIAQRETDEAEFIVQTIMSLRRQGNYSLNDFAILMRINALSRNLEQKLIQYNIKHKIYGGFKFFERKEIKDMLAYLRISVNPVDNEALLRIINFPKRGIGKGTVKQAINYAELNGLRLYDVLYDIENNPDLPIGVIKKLKPFGDVLKKLELLKVSDDPVEFLGGLVELLNLRELFSEDTDENVSRKMNIAQLIQMAEEFKLHNNVGEPNEENSSGKLETFMQMVSLYSDTDEMNDDDGSVKIITAHSAKGLEFKVVFIIGLEEGLFPSRRSIDNLNLEEERRLMYVAITRAKKLLYLTRTKSRFLYSGRKDCLPSRFLYELGLEKKAEARKTSISYTTNNYNYNMAKSNNYNKVGFTSDTGKPKQNNNALNLYKVGTRVRHIKFGEGEIISIEDGGQYADIRFDKAEVGVLNLSLKFAPITIIEE